MPIVPRKFSAHKNTLRATQILKLGTYTDRFAMTEIRNELDDYLERESHFFENHVDGNQ